MRRRAFSSGLKGRAEAMVALLEGVLGDRPGAPVRPMPEHFGAIHLYVHAVEISGGRSGRRPMRRGCCAPPRRRAMRPSPGKRAR
ncbi:hypothetical protein QMO56_04980 [Roseomonas sp. E05]|uniref:hypothetical protein n=1 Tax=Roseomonas sp. E05 TaxID=3046310 RepID=UPI0024BB0EEE|nr:hypothetical protein [Roseomonas sp. E05]MDJ0387458.1 hypothetical protein [Roseomonas sp. E05]